MKYEKVRDNKNYMFAPFHSTEEYKQMFEEVMDVIPKGEQFKFVMFMERFRSSILTDKERE
tara:strand:- start:49 stop:231 length:183 start_codon:yes stop_codon:yes gene_type:complete